ncbi:Transglutaminase-like domain protein [Hyella patelloides LEGE 07179]|uniref:Transglutaminase-like domain protein n=1 Tax=Hyella patelloides LEGE 07179 TaxID=945734 RepID=A0A563VR02_9CYAN|nr:transglutaminase family protein [Hyella patelloides]VEP13831.1 Transglutaminase-like domain protein [Hyella patelloides LEGE 07179]
MKFKVGCELNYEVSNDSTFILNICAVENEYQQVIDANLQIKPDRDLEEYIAPHTENSYLRLVIPKGKLEVSYQATVNLKHSVDNPDEISERLPSDIPLDIIHYLYPSRYCQSDRLMKLSQDEFGNCQPGYARVQAVCDWIYDKVTYISGSTDSHTSAYDTVTERAGVCRDFAHLGIAFCRALSIPARFVSAYAWQLQPPDFHACFEAYLGDKWYLFDPTRLAPREGLVRIGTGKDAADTAFATVFGAVQLNNMQVYIDCLDDKSLKTKDMAIANT